jgi:hypothetical protein
MAYLASASMNNVKVAGRAGALNLSVAFEVVRFW